jgi:DHA1 family inner membrane transport protein
MTTTQDTCDALDTSAAPDAGTGRTRPGLVLALLFLATFTLGHSEELVVGVLDLIAEDLRVPIPTVGGLVTAYAIVLAIGGPVLTALTIRINRKGIAGAAAGLSS